MSDAQTLVIACGGTGGHLFPGIAVAEEWQRQGRRAVLLISEKKVDATASRKYGELEFVKMPAVAKPATLSFKMLPFLWKLWKTDRKCRSVLKQKGARAVLGMGGFTSLPPVHAGHSLGLPAYVHDSNALPGKANRLTARWCDKVLIGMEAARGYFPNQVVEMTGTPVRKELEQEISKADACAKFGLNAEKPVILVMGGSQGARHLNSMIAEAAKELGDVQILHLAGASDAERVRGLTDQLAGYHVLDFCNDMAAAYAAADFAICRSGASSMTELAYLGLPSLLVPYPHAADDHQTKNAAVFVAAGAAEMRQESELNGDDLVSLVRKCMEPQSLGKMKAALDSLAVKDAAAKICAVVIDEMNVRGAIA